MVETAKDSPSSFAIATKRIDAIESAPNLKKLEFALIELRGRCRVRLQRDCNCFSTVDEGWRVSLDDNDI